MITISKTFYISSSDTSVTSIDWAVSKSSSCITVDSSSGTITGTSGSINLSISFTNSLCMANETITITTTDSNSCSNPETYSFDDICANLTTTISLSNESNGVYTFIASAAGGIAPYTYQWNFDTNVFSGTSTTDLIALTLVDSTVPDSTEIQVILTDGYGCTVGGSFTYNFQKPIAENGSASLSCGSNLDYCTDAISVKNDIQLVATAFEGRTIDWTTLTFTTNTSGLCINNKGSGVIDIYAKESASTGIRSLAWYVKDSYGLQSDGANFNLWVPVCTATEEVIFIADSTTVLPDNTFGNATNIPIDTLVTDDTVLDYGTFDFVAATGQVKNSSTDLTSNNADVLLLNREINYTFDTKTVPVDIVQFDISDDSGNQVNRVKIYFDAELYPTPTTVADSLDVVAGQSATVDLLSNDTGNINTTRVKIVTEPTKGSYSITEGVLTYTAGSDLGSDTPTYNVYSNNGIVSNTSNISVNIIGAGTSYSASHCDQGTTYDADTPLGTKTAGGVWAADVGNPSVIGVGTPTALDFSAATDGSYIFTYTVTSGSASDVSTITIDFEDYEITSGTESITAFTGFVYEIDGSITVKGFDAGSDITAYLYEISTGGGDPITDGARIAELTLSYDSINDKFTYTANTTDEGLRQNFTYKVQIIGNDPCGVAHSYSTVNLSAL